MKNKKSILSLSQQEKQTLLDLLKPYYVDPSVLLKRELSRNDTIYLEYQGGMLLSFFMVGWEKHNLQGVVRDAVYMGLSCTRAGNRKNNNASRVYYYFIRDACKYEQKHGKQLFLYGTTATAIILLTLPKLFSDVRPNTGGKYSMVDKAMIEDLKRSVGLDRFSDTHPYVLRNQAASTEYATSEKLRQAQIVRRFGITTFEDLGLNEDKGDRLLITCRTPSMERVKKLELKLFPEMSR